MKSLSYLQLSSFTRKQFYRRLQAAYASGSLKLVKRIHALLALAQGQNVHEVAQMIQEHGLFLPESALGLRPSQ